MRFKRVILGCAISLPVRLIDGEGMPTKHADLKEGPGARVALEWAPIGNDTCVLPGLAASSVAPYCRLPLSQTYCSLPRPREYQPRKVRFNSSVNEDWEDHHREVASLKVVNITTNSSAITVEVVGPPRRLWNDPIRQLVCHDELILLLRGSTAQAAVTSTGNLSSDGRFCSYSLSLRALLTGRYFVGVYVGYLYGFNRLYPRAMKVPGTFNTDCWLHFHSNEELQDVWPMNRKTMGDFLLSPGLIRVDLGDDLGTPLFDCEADINGIWVHRHLWPSLRKYCENSDQGGSEDLDPRYNYVFLSRRGYRRLDHRQVLARHGISMALVGDSTMEDYLDHLLEDPNPDHRPKACGHNLQTLFYGDPDSTDGDGCDMTQRSSKWTIAYRRYYGSYQHHEGMEVIMDLRLSSPNVIFFGENFHTSSKDNFPKHRLKLLPLQWDVLLPIPEASRDGLHWHRSFYPCGVRPVDGKSFSFAQDPHLGNASCDREQCVDFLEGYTNAASHAGRPSTGVHLRNLVPDAGVETMMQIMLNEIDRFFSNGSGSCMRPGQQAFRWSSDIGGLLDSQCRQDVANPVIPAEVVSGGGDAVVSAGFLLRCHLLRLLKEPDPEQMGGLLGSAVEGLGGLEGVAAGPGLEAATLAAFAQLNNPTQGQSPLPAEMLDESLEVPLPKKRGRPKGAKKGTGRGRERKGVGAGKKACSECGTINPCRQMQCTECGHEMTPKGTTKRRRESSVPAVIGDLSVSPLAVVPPIGEPGGALVVKGKESAPPGYRPCDACNSLQPSARKVCANCGAPIIPKSMTSRYWTALRSARPKLPEPFVHPPDLFPSWRTSGTSGFEDITAEDIASAATKAVCSDEPLEVVFERVSDPSAPNTAAVRPGEGVWVDGQGWIINAGRSQELMSLSPSYGTRPMVVALASRTESTIELWPLEKDRVQKVRRLIVGGEVADFHWVEFSATSARVGILCVLFCAGYAALYDVPNSILHPSGLEKAAMLKLRAHTEIRPTKKCLGIHAMRNRDKIWILAGLESGSAAIFRVDEEAEGSDGKVLRKPLSILSCSGSGEVSPLLAVQWAPVEPESDEAPEIFAVATQNGSVWVMSTSCPYPLATAASPAKFWVTDLCWSRMAPDHVFLACQLALAIDVTCPPSGSWDVRRCDLAGTNRSLLQCKFMRPEVRQGYNSQACSALQTSSYAPWTFTGWTDGFLMGINTSDDLVRWTQYLIARYSYTAVDASKTLRSHMSTMTVQHHRQAFFSGGNVRIHCELHRPITRPVRRRKASILSGGGTVKPMPGDPIAAVCVRAGHSEPTDHVVATALTGGLVVIQSTSYLAKGPQAPRSKR
ncbi:hypothetical protein FOZ60_008400 [Perkinsus olseni]|uniref:Uncharacterized protein n=3 Tax=Perkinsus olseni TaxID=32597 RepID=A0A7J6NJ93_PEROL|nr:hypothetical protein FOZ60_008400 [Perkinsus olseni]